MSPIEIKELMVATGGSASDRAVALLIASGMTATKDIAEALGLTQRAVQMAKKRIQLREASFACEANFAKPASPAKDVSPRSEAGFAALSTEARARAYKESPTEIVTLERGQRPTPDVPHLAEDGSFVISVEHDLRISSEIIASWRRRFPAIPDLTAKIEKLSTVILARGFMHNGWAHPAAWMAGLLSDENTKAANTAREASLREQRATGIVPFRPASQERRVLDSLCAGGAA